MSFRVVYRLDQINKLKYLTPGKSKKVRSIKTDKVKHKTISTNETMDNNCHIADLEHVFKRLNLKYFEKKFECQNYIIFFQFSFILDLASPIATSNTVYVSKGMSAVLKCQVSPNSKATWDGPNGQSLVKIADGLEINPSLSNKRKLKIVGNITDGDYNMQISNVSAKEEGIYKCFQINYQKMTARETFVTLIIQGNYTYYN